MCHLSKKPSDMFDPTPMYTSDKIVVKHISVKESLTLSLKVKVSKKQKIISKWREQKSSTS